MGKAVISVRKVVAVTLVLGGIAVTNCWADDDPQSGSDSDNAPSGRTLKGGVNEVAPIEPAARPPKFIEEMPTPVVAPRKANKKLQGNAEDEGGPRLQGNATDEDADLSGQNGREDSSRSKVLQGAAKIDDSELAKEDPDAEDQELAVQWDAWRNRFLTSVQSGVQEQLNNPDDAMLRWDPERQAVMVRFPLGTVAWFSCRITNDRRIVNLKLQHSSGFPNYDQAVINAVKSLEGSVILKYPKRSRRLVVTQIAGIKTSDSADQQYFHFGDVEHYRVPASQ